jgi:hypothetical protein
VLFFAPDGIDSDSPTLHPRSLPNNAVRVHFVRFSAPHSFALGSQFALFFVSFFVESGNPQNARQPLDSSVFSRLKNGNQNVNGNPQNNVFRVIRQNPQNARPVCIQSRFLRSGNVPFLDIFGHPLSYQRLRILR